MTKQPTHLRRLSKLVVMPGFQLRLIGLNLFSTLGFLAFAYLGIKRSFDYVRNLGVQAHLAPQHPFFNFQGLQEKHVLTYFFSAALVFVAVNAVLTLIVSHRLSGPLFRLKKELIKIKETGAVTHIQFRKGDYTENIDVLLNEAFAAATEKSKDERKAS